MLIEDELHVVNQSIHHLGLRDAADLPALAIKDPDPAPAGKTHIGMLRLARAIHHTAHDGDGQL
jgi:hypothetical protein